MSSKLTSDLKIQVFSAVVKGVGGMCLALNDRAEIFID